MIDFDHGVDPMWQASMLRHMATWCLRLDDPQERFDSWLDEATHGDEDYVRWAIETWKKVSIMTSSSLEQLVRQTNFWQSHRKLGSDQQSPP